MAPPIPPAGDAFERAFREHYAGMCTFVCRYLQSNAAAEDVVQDVWATLWRRGATDDQLTKAYLYTAARNHALHQLERARVAERHTDVTRNALDNDRDGDTDPVALSELERAAARAIAELPGRCRMIYQLVRQDGLTYAEAANVLGISVSTVEVQMWRAMKKLRHAVAPYLALVCAATWRISS